MPGKIRTITKAMLTGPEFPVAVQQGVIRYQWKDRAGKWVDGPTMSAERVRTYLETTVYKMGKDFRFVVTK